MSVHAIMLFAALSATSPETSFVSRAIPARAVTTATVETATKTWGWSGIFEWSRQLAGFIFKVY